MPVSDTLRVQLPPNILPLRVTIEELSETRDEYGQREEVFTPVSSMTNLRCLFTTGVRGSVRDFGLRKDDREHVRPRANIVMEGVHQVEYGSCANVTWTADDLGGARTERWRVVATEHRPMSDLTRVAVEQIDGVVRT